MSVLIADAAPLPAFAQTAVPILVSFVNIIDQQRRTRLGVLDPDSLAFMPLEAPPELVPEGVDISGMALSSRYIFLGLRSAARSSLLVLRRTDLAVVNHYAFRLVRDVHALWASNWSLFVASTGTNEVVGLRLFDHEVCDEIVIWRPDPDGPRVDQHHINTVSVWRNDLIIAGFGAKVVELWEASRQGFILNHTRGETIESGIAHPHALLAFDDTLAYCESRTRSVRLVGSSRSQQLPGYTRGLCRVGDKLFVGTSLGRFISRSTGRIRSLADLGPDEGLCSVSRLDAGSLEIEQTVDLTGYSNEIYDLLPAPGLRLSAGWLGSKRF